MEPSPLNHKRHIILTFLTFGLWLLVYLPLFLITLSPSRAKKMSDKRLAKNKTRNLRAAERKSRNEEFGRLNALGPQNLGYKPTKGGYLAEVWVLECNHNIRSKQSLAKGKQGRFVWCVVCNAERRVAGRSGAYGGIQ